MGKFLIDANVFIQAKNFHYQFCFCQGFWNFLLNLHEKKILYSLKSVYHELVEVKKDELAIWVQKNIPESFWLDDYDAIEKYAEIIRWAHNNPSFKPVAKKNFADLTTADPWLVSYAATFNYSIISQEKSNPFSPRKIYLADAAKEFRVPYFTIYEFLTEYAKADFCCKEINEISDIENPSE